MISLPPHKVCLTSLDFNHKKKLLDDDQLKNFLQDIYKVVLI